MRIGRKRGSGGGNAHDTELREELEFHLEMRTRENIARGLSPAEARAEAERRFGPVDAIEARMRAFGGTGSRTRRSARGALAGDVLRDARFAARSLARRPGFAALAVLTLALGIGANTALFSLVNAVLLRSVPGVRHPGSLVTVHFGRGEELDAMYWVSHPDYADVAAAPNPALEGLSTVARTPVHVTLPGQASPQRLAAELVTSNHAKVLGLRPHLGAAPGPEHADGAAVVMISHHFWSVELGRSPDVLGMTLLVNGRPVGVIGVGPPGFRGVSLFGDVDLWVPVEAHLAVLPGDAADRLSDRRGTMHGEFFGRLEPGATPEQAQALLRAAVERVEDAHPDSPLRGLVAVVTPGAGISPYARREFAGIVRILGGVVGFVLLLACANAANLLLARGTARTEELSIRRAIGAGRGRLVRQLLTEALLLSVAGGAAGLLFAWLGLRLFQGERVISWLPALSGIPIDPRVLLFAIGVSLTTGLLFGIAPALASTQRAEQALRGARTTAGGTRLRGGLVVIQVAVSLALVMGAGLLLDTLRGLRTVDLGFAPEGVTEATIDPGTQGYDDAARARYFTDLLARVRADPDVRAAGLAWAPIQGLILGMTRVRPEGIDAEDERVVSTRTNQVTPGFFEAVGMELVEGRDFRDDDLFGAGSGSGVIILSELAARRAFPQGGAVGRRVDIGWREPLLVEVIGIVADARLASPRDEPGPLSFEPFGQQRIPGAATLYARSRTNTFLGAGLQRAAAGSDASLPFYGVRPLRDRVEERLAEERMLARVTALFAGLALLLAAVGVYGVMACSVGERTREFGVRLALGADPAGVRRMVLGQGLMQVGVGIVVGLFAATQMARLVASRLYGVRALEPGILVGSALMLLAAAVLASLVPAWRATRVDPVKALRGE